jgi:hypothetical protein
MNSYVSLLLRALGLLACGAVLIGAVWAAYPRPFEWRPWPVCLGIAVVATVVIATIAWLMLQLPQ